MKGVAEAGVSGKVRVPLFSDEGILASFILASLVLLSCPPCSTLIILSSGFYCQCRALTSVCVLVVMGRSRMRTLGATCWICLKCACGHLFVCGRFGCFPFFIRFGEPGRCVGQSHGPRVSEPVSVVGWRVPCFERAMLACLACAPRVACMRSCWYAGNCRCVLRRVPEGVRGERRRRGQCLGQDQGALVQRFRYPGELSILASLVTILADRFCPAHS